MDRKEEGTTGSRRKGKKENNRTWCPPSAKTTANVTRQVQLCSCTCTCTCTCLQRVEKEESLQ